MSRPKGDDDPKQARLKFIAAEKNLAYKTIQTYASYWATWRAYERAAEVPFPFDPRRTYTSFSKWMVTTCEYCEGTINNTLNQVADQHKLMNGAFACRNPGEAMAEVDDALQRAKRIAVDRGSIMAQADPLLISQFRRLPQKIQAFVIIWSQTGQRLATACEWQPDNVGFMDMTTYLVFHSTAKYMPVNHSCFMPIVCNCTNRHGREFCPICNPDLRTAVNQLVFPVPREEIEKAFKDVGATVHCIRRLCAIYIAHMARRLDARKFLVTARHLQILGRRVNYSFLWSQKSVTYNRYSADAMRWRLSELVPCMSLCRFIYDGEQRFPVDQMWPTPDRKIPAEKFYKYRQQIFKQMVNTGRIACYSSKGAYVFEGASKILAKMLDVSVDTPEFKLNFDVGQLDTVSIRKDNQGPKVNIIDGAMSDLSGDETTMLHLQRTLSNKVEATRFHVSVEGEKKKKRRAKRHGYAIKSSETKNSKRGKRGDKR